jgi:four helix bundle protein
MRSAFRDLAAYQRAGHLADYLRAEIARWPLDDRNTSGRQLMRCCDSIGANIAESSGRWHRAEQRQFLYYARGSLLETEHWVTTAERRGLLEAGTSDRLTDIARALSGMIRNAR